MVGRALLTYGKEIMKQKKQEPLIVALEGGLVSCVASADKRLIGRSVVVIDYDTDGLDPQDLIHVRWHKTAYASAGQAKAYAHGDEVAKTCLTPGTRKRLMEEYHEDKT